MDAVIGVDIGQVRDPTAICVAEVENRSESEDKDDYHYLIRFLDRLPLGTPYPQAVRRIADIARGVVQLTNRYPTMYVDATGVGQPIIDLLRQEETQARLKAVYFTYGDKRTPDQKGVKLGKAFLVSRLQVLLQSGRLHLPRTSEAQVLAQELQDYEIRVNKKANDIYGAFRVGTHDDLVTALGLAVNAEPVRWRLL